MVLKFGMWLPPLLLQSKINGCADLLKSKINGSADFLELGSQVIVFSAGSFLDVAVGSVDPACVADTVSSQGSCSGVEGSYSVGSGV